MFGGSPGLVVKGVGAEVDKVVKRVYGASVFFVYDTLKDRCRESLGIQLTLDGLPAEVVGEGAEFTDLSKRLGDSDLVGVFVDLRSCLTNGDLPEINPWGKSILDLTCAGVLNIGGDLVEKNESGLVSISEVASGLLAVEPPCVKFKKLFQGGDRSGTFSGGFFKKLRGEAVGVSTGLFGQIAQNVSIGGDVGVLVGASDEYLVEAVLDGGDGLVRGAEGVLFDRVGQLA